MARPQVADGGDGLQICRAAANILNKQSCTADRGWPSSFGFGRGVKTPTITPLICYYIMPKAADQDGFFGTTEAPENGYEIWHLECQEPLQDRLIDDSEGVGEV
jgi:hypothetical protein